MKWNGKVGLFLLCFLILSASCSFARASDEHPLSSEPPLTNETVILNNDRGQLPLGGLGDRTIALILPSDSGLEVIGDQLERYAKIQRVYTSTGGLANARLDEAIKYYNTLIFVISESMVAEESERLLEFLGVQSLGKEVIVMLTGPGTMLRHFDKVDLPIVWTAGQHTTALRHAAMSVFGGLDCNGRLQANYSPRYRKGAGAITRQVRLSYDGAAHSSVNEGMLRGAIDRIMDEAMQAGATPGAVIMVVQDGNVILENAYGYHTYARQRATQVSDIFDLASITKIAATTPLVMRLVEQGSLDLNQTVGHYLWQATKTDKSDLKLRHVLLHEAGLIPYIPFHRMLRTDNVRTDSSATHGVKIASGKFLRSGYYERVMWPAMLASKLRSPGTYAYSDVGMYIMKEIVEHQTATSIDELVQEQFYRPLGMYTTGFNPWICFDPERIVPTEDDRIFRNSLLRGYVHDQGAAMAGGVAGHAGLFSTANDLAIFGQMLLNRGQYGGERYFDPETVDLFTSRQSTVSRRGLGFDRRAVSPAGHYPSKMASEATYGHTGYTGTALWVDPEKRLVFIFLSNRVHPRVSSKLSELAIRRRILDMVYVAIH